MHLYFPSDFSRMSIRCFGYTSNRICLKSTPTGFSNAIMAPPIKINSIDGIFLFVDNFIVNASLPFIDYQWKYYLSQQLTKVRVLPYLFIQKYIHIKKFKKVFLIFFCIFYKFKSDVVITLFIWNILIYEKIQRFLDFQTRNAEFRSDERDGLSIYLYVHEYMWRACNRQGDDNLIFVQI